MRLCNRLLHCPYRSSGSSTVPCYSKSSRRTSIGTLSCTRCLAADLILNLKIDAVTKDWQERQAKKKEQKSGSSEKPSTDSKADDERAKPDTPTPPPSTSSPSSSTSTPTQKLKLEKFALHKDIFRMRIDKWNRKRATNRAKQIPGAPRSKFS